METLRQTIKTLFLLQKSETVIEGYLCNRHDDSCVDKAWFVRCYLDDIGPLRTKDQVESVYALLNTKWMNGDDEQTSYVFRPTSSVFNTLVHFSACTLREYNHEPICKYEDLLRWHHLSSLLGEDILTTSFLASKDLLQGIKRQYFNWKDVIDHDNSALNSMFHRPMIDLHYHLYGSIFVFDLNWLSLMNDVTDRKESFRKIQEYLHVVHVISSNERITSLYGKVMKAAAIRLRLFCYVEEYKDAVREVFFDEMLGANDELQIDTLCMELSPHLVAARSLKGYAYANWYGQESVIDYAISNEIMVNASEDDEYIYSVLAGERYLMYRMFRLIYSGACDSDMATLFYSYLLIKAEFRNELVQLNDSKGFANFSDYQGRKGNFLKTNSVYSDIAAQVAIGSSLSDKGKELEVRITPKDTKQLLASSVNNIDRSIHNGVLTCSMSKRLEERYAFILHFLKKRDGKQKIKRGNDLHCRHYDLRKKIKKEAIALKEWLKECSESDTDSRIIGVDAASSEIACRAEVFGQAYRYLKCYTPTSSYSKKDHELGFTFHVGEDFLDIVDGLRAIREALLFLNLENRDRIGHGLVLGTQVDKYYAKRGYYISMTKQMLLDNVVWLYFEGSTCEGFNKIAVRLKALYAKYFNAVYGKSLMLKNAKKPYVVSIEDYYQSWLLRGDNPEAYRNPWAVNHDSTTFFDIYALNNKAEVCEARLNEKACYLYYLYHYNDEVYDEGNKSDLIKLDEDLISVIKQLQAKMLSEIEKLHISIETNPTSNYRIGDFGRYDEHPILQFYNYGLKHAGQPEHSVTVSINTDDKGVFSTSLEREFSVMAAAMEKKCDIEHEGNSPRMIYDWLDRIREMAFEMKF